MRSSIEKVSAYEKKTKSKTTKPKKIWSSMHVRMSIRGRFHSITKEIWFFHHVFHYISFFWGGGRLWMTSNGSLWNVTFFMFFRMSYEYLFYWMHRAAVLQSSQKFRQRNFCINICTLFYLFLLLFFLPFIFQVWNDSKMKKKSHFPWGEHIQMES